MNLTVKVLSQDDFVISHEPPANFGYPWLPGGEVLTLQSRFGSICIQEYATADFILRYGVLQPKVDLTIDIRNTVSGVHCLLLQRGHIQCRFPGQHALKLRQGHYSILQAELLQFNITLEANKQYSGYEIIFPFDAAAQVLEEYPDYAQRLQPSGLLLPDFWLPAPLPIPPEASRLLGEVLFFNDSVSERSYYYHEEALEVFALLLEQRDAPGPPALTAEQISKVQQVQAAILEDLGEKDTTRKLSKLVGWSESILKRNFKSYTGQAIHQFRKAKRLDLALALLHEGKLVKEVADQLGLTAGWLIKLYKKRYGTTPALMRKK